MLNFIHNKKSLVESPFGYIGGLSSNVPTPSIARCKAFGWVPVGHNWTYFRYLLGWDAVSGNLPMLAFFEGGGSLWAQISDRRGRRRPTTVVVRKLVWYQNIRSALSGFRQKARVWRIEGPNYRTANTALT